VSSPCANRRFKNEICTFLNLLVARNGSCMQLVGIIFCK
jgi:hypothetical protein